MKFFNQGSTFRVTASEDDVYNFFRSWPCSNLRHGDRVSMTFEARTGDLVDLQVTHALAGPVDRGDCESLAVLADYAKMYGLARISHHENKNPSPRGGRAHPLGPIRPLA